MNKFLIIILSLFICSNTYALEYKLYNLEEIFQNTEGEYKMNNRGEVIWTKDGNFKILKDNHVEELIIPEIEALTLRKKEGMQIHAFTNSVLVGCYGPDDTLFVYNFHENIYIDMGYELRSNAPHLETAWIFGHANDHGTVVVEGMQSFAVYNPENGIKKFIDILPENNNGISVTYRPKVINDNSEVLILKTTILPDNNVIKEFFLYHPQGETVIPDLDQKISDALTRAHTEFGSVPKNELEHYERIIFKQMNNQGVIVGEFPFRHNLNDRKDRFEYQMSFVYYPGSEIILLDPTKKMNLSRPVLNEQNQILLSGKNWDRAGCNTKSDYTKTYLYEQEKGMTAIPYPKFHEKSDVNGTSIGSSGKVIGHSIIPVDVGFNSTVTRKEFEKYFKISTKGWFKTIGVDMLEGNFEYLYTYDKDKGFRYLNDVTDLNGNQFERLYQIPIHHVSESGYILTLYREASLNSSDHTEKKSTHYLYAPL